MGFFDYEQETGGDESVLSSLTEPELQMVVDQAELLTFAKGDELVRAGDTDSSIYVLVEGAVEASDGRRVVAEIPEGSVFGEIAFFDHRPRTAYIRAATDGRALRLTRARFDRLAGFEPALAQKVLFEVGRVVCLRLRRVMAAVA